MPWCPKCKTEYREGFTACTDCGAPLVGSLPKAATETASGEPKLLISLGDVLEADRLEALLESAGIPCARKYEGAGQYLSMVGSLPHLGVDLYVPEKYLEAAAELLHAYRADGEGPSEEREVQTDPSDFEWKRRNRAWLLVAVLVLGSALSGIALFWQYIVILLEMLFR